MTHLILNTYIPSLSDSQKYSSSSKNETKNDGLFYANLNYYN